MVSSPIVSYRTIPPLAVPYDVIIVVFSECAAFAPAALQALQARRAGVQPANTRFRRYAPRFIESDSKATITQQWFWRYRAPPTRSNMERRVCRTRQIIPNMPAAAGVLKK